jgi:4-amino-4-deoxy-L-arabinose transferase-like glycosyltransferase
MTTRILLVLILVLATLLRVYQVDSYGIFFDEKATILVSQKICMEGAANQLDIFGQATFTPKDFWKEKTTADFYDAITRGDIGNSPFYYVLLMGWQKIFGLTDLSMRMLSVLFSVLFIGLLFVFIKTHLKNTNLAVFASLLAAIEPFFIAYSHQARNYSLTFFLTLLATHVFLLIVRADTRRYALYLAYGVLCGLCLLSHFLSFAVFLGHGLYVLLFVRKPIQWLLLPLFLSIGLGMMALWLTKGGGQYTLRSLDGQAKFYHTIAHSKPNAYAGYIDPAEPLIVLKKATPILADLSIVSNGLGDELTGKKNLIIALVGALLLIGFLYFKEGKDYPWLPFVPSVLLLICYLGFTINKFNFLELIVVGVLLFLLGKSIVQEKDPHKQRIYYFFAWMSIIPLLVLVAFSFKNGHTYGLTPRYQGFGFPYAIILTSIALFRLWKLELYIKIPLMIVLFAHLGYIKTVLFKIYGDTSGKYCYFVEPRKANPHYAVAQDIKRLYQPGDTLLYPSFTNGTYADFEKKTISYLDAQMVNLYLPKEALYTQKMNPSEPDKVILKRKNGESITLFDFEGKKYRY